MGQKALEDLKVNIEETENMRHTTEGLRRMTVAMSQSARLPSAQVPDDKAQATRLASALVPDDRSQSTRAPSAFAPDDRSQSTRAPSALVQDDGRFAMKLESPTGLPPGSPCFEDLPSTPPKVRESFTLPSPPMAFDLKRPERLEGWAAASSVVEEVLRVRLQELEKLLSQTQFPLAGRANQDRVSPNGEVGANALEALGKAQADEIMAKPWPPISVALFAKAPVPTAEGNQMQAVQIEMKGNGVFGSNGTHISLSTSAIEDLREEAARTVAVAAVVAELQRVQDKLASAATAALNQLN